MGACFLESTVTEMEMLLVVAEFLKQLQRAWEDKLFGNNWAVVAEKGVQEKSFRQNLKNKAVRRRDIFTNMSH